MKVLMVFCSTPLQVVWDYCAGILIFWEAEKEMNAQSFCILSKNISVGVRGQKYTKCLVDGLLKRKDKKEKGRKEDL